MYWTFVAGAVRLRRRRLALAFAALAVAAALATSLFTTYADVERRISAEFASYGANLVIAPAGANVTVPLSAVQAARATGAVAAPFLIWQGKLDGRPVLVEGVDYSSARPLIAYWHVEGSPAGCVAGATLAQQLHLKVGDPARVEGAECRLSGIVTTGGSEDNELILPFGMVAEASGIRDAASLVEVRVPAARLEEVQRELAKRLPGAAVRPVRAVAETESSVVVKVRVVMFLLFALVLAITTLSLTSNFTELVLERSREIGILKAIGAAEEKIAALFLSESVALALGSTLVGYLAGLVLAGWIAKSVFSTPFAIHFGAGVLALAAGITIAVALAAASFAAGRIWRIQPAVILRGE